MNFYSYAPRCGMSYHPTKELAIEAAVADIHAAMKQSADPLELEMITWGEVTERAHPTGNVGFTLKRQDRLSYEAEHPQIIDGRMRDENDSLVLVKNIHDKDLLFHDLVLSIAIIWKGLAGKIERFKGHNFRDVQAVLSLLFEHYKITRGGRDGNMQFFTFDRKYKLQIAIQKGLDFGPELQAAEVKLLESARQLTTAVSGDADSVQAADLETIVTASFKRIDGKVSVSKVLGLRRFKIHNTLWNEAMDIIDEAIIVTSKKQQIRLYERIETGAYVAIPLDIAAL